MAKNRNIRLVDLLSRELNQMDDRQKGAFREALKSELPRAIRRAGRVATAQQVMELPIKEIEHNED